ncbi:SGNH/GDSL hydrolase family protein [Streptomyces sp. NBC_01725]|uniref:SGNH/GDSL hydrolase family protein n=1 Tax=Streptomyces sp. NBC_01725 TaxID=2975923 RepID=UPI002E29D69D|nr:SGNH/GDSL hydrolase family protein [Streptomyces sp. NBC_01725]
MARFQFGRGIADYVVRPSDGLWGIGAGATVTFWSDADAGTPYTDLLDAAGSPITEVTTDGQGRIPAFAGPDAVTGMWADAGGTSRAYIEARGTGTGGGEGGGAYTSITRIVASSTAPADVRAAATYVCDGIADQVQIQAALDDARDNGGGEVQLTVGDFHLSAPLSIEGTDDVDTEIGIALRGQGARATMLTAGDGLTSAVHLTKVVRVVLESLGLTIDGATDGITSATTNGATSGHRSFWNSSFKNLQINGPWSGDHTGWAINLGSPFRSVFENIEIGGVGNGVRFYSEHEDFNPGDCTVERVFVELVGDGGTAYMIESTTADGVMNQLEMEMCEALANGEGCTGIHIAGAGGWGTAHTSWRGVNLEQFDRLLHVEYGSSNSFRFNHVGLRAAGLTAFTFGPNSFNNTVLSTGLLYASDDCTLYADANTLEPTAPNRVLDSRVYRSSDTVAVSGILNAAATTVRRGIVGNTTINTPGPQPPGVFVPEGWGRTWLAKRSQAAAGTGLARIVTVGGSATLGYFASNPRTKSWPGVVASALQAAYGDGGSGFHGVSLSNTLSGDNAAAYAAWLTAGAAVAQTGTWTQGGSSYGPGGTYLYSDTTGSTLIFKARGTTVRIYTVIGGSTRPAMLYSVDGGADVSVAQPTGTAAIQTTTISGLSAGEHTVQVKVGTASSGQYVSVCGIAGENASGVLVHNVALAGATSSRFANDAPTALNAVWNGGGSFPADLAVLSTAPNDAAANIAGDVWLANVAGWIRAVRAAGNGTDILLALPHIGTHEGTNNRYQEYSRLVRPLADAYGCAVINWWTTGQNSWAYWNGLGYWGSSTTPGAVGTDGVHMSDAGFQHMANTVLPFVAS